MRRNKLVRHRMVGSFPVLGLTVGEVPPSPAVEEELELTEVTEEIVKTLSPEVYPCNCTD